MKSIIVNQWQPLSEGRIEFAHILHHDRHPEGLDFYRVRFLAKESYHPPTDCGALASVVAGELSLQTNQGPQLKMVAGTHAYLPPGSAASFRGQPGTQLIVVLAPKADRARGERLLLRDDRFLAACALEDQPLRWILTPQYLSRRVFLHHDKTLVSPSGDPLSWFHTTMFDVEGLPSNEEGVPVFKMSYNFRTEPNVCYEVTGEAALRVARHPYSQSEQSWGPWQPIDSATTYHLNESAALAQWHQDARGNRPRRNKHEVRIVAGHVSLMCMHDPAPTGAEKHATGEYSEYGDLSKTLGTPAYQEYLQTIEALDQMVDTLSMAKARGEELSEDSPAHQLYRDGLAAQKAMESEMDERLVAEERGRENILRRWMLVERA